MHCVMFWHTTYQENYNLVIIVIKIIPLAFKWVCSTVSTILFVLLQLVWIVVFLATVFLGADTGLGVGIEFSLFLIIIRIIL